MAERGQDRGMTENDERLDAVTEKIDDAKDAARTLADKDVIDPDPVEGQEWNDVSPSQG
jgi:hypothetical protein